MPTLKESALHYAEQGFAVFPLIPREKKPATTNGFKDATTDLKQISFWWDMDPNYNIGIATGKPSGGLVVMDVNTCMVDTARFFMNFICKESCGKCTPCRVGTKRLLEILDRIIAGKGDLKDLDELE